MASYGNTLGLIGGTSHTSAGYSGAHLSNYGGVGSYGGYVQSGSYAQYPPPPPIPADLAFQKGYGGALVSNASNYLPTPQQQWRDEDGSIAAPPVVPASTVRRGIGLQLRAELSGDLRIIDFQKGGAAERNGRLYKDDLLVLVEGVSVRGLSARAVATMISSVPETHVRLSVRSGDSIDAPLRHVHVKFDDDVVPITTTTTSAAPIIANDDSHHLSLFNPAPRLSPPRPPVDMQEGVVMTDENQQQQQLHEKREAQIQAANAGTLALLKLANPPPPPSAAPHQHQHQHQQDWADENSENMANLANTSSGFKNTSSGFKIKAEQQQQQHEQQQNVENMPPMSLTSSANRGMTQDIGGLDNPNPHVHESARPMMPAARRLEYNGTTSPNAAQQILMQQQQQMQMEAPVFQSSMTSESARPVLPLSDASALPPPPAFLQQQAAIQQLHAEKPLTSALQELGMPAPVVAVVNGSSAVSSAASTPRIETAMPAAQAFAAPAVMSQQQVHNKDAVVVGGSSKPASTATTPAPASASTPRMHPPAFGGDLAAPAASNMTPSAAAAHQHQQQMSATTSGASPLPLPSQQIAAAAPTTATAISSSTTTTTTAAAPLPAHSQSAAIASAEPAFPPTSADDKEKHGNCKCTIM